MIMDMHTICPPLRNLGETFLDPPPSNNERYVKDHVQKLTFVLDCMTMCNTTDLQFMDAQNLSGYLL